MFRDSSSVCPEGCYRYFVNVLTDVAGFQYARPGASYDDLFSCRSDRCIVPSQPAFPEDEILALSGDHVSPNIFVVTVDVNRQSCDLIDFRRGFTDDLLQSSWSNGYFLAVACEPSRDRRGTETPGVDESGNVFVIKNYIDIRRFAFDRTRSIPSRPQEPTYSWGGSFPDSDWSGSSLVVLAVVAAFARVCPLPLRGQWGSGRL